jgi:PPM family protein phosphatase
MSESTAIPPTPPATMVIRAVLRTDVGRVRSENQDFGAMSTRDEERHEGHPGGRLLIVADGMGGHRGGATASRVAAETVKAQYLGSETGDVAAALGDALTRANARVYAEAQSNPDLRGMGTTTSALVVRGDEAWFAHVGDSRIYLVRHDEIRQLTEDHSLVASMVREGLLTAQEAETHPRRNVLQRSIGVSEQVEIDVSGPLKIESGDTFIICSDGLHGVVKENELRDVARQSIENAADEFIRRALERGAPDNVTVIVARAELASEGTISLDETQVDHPDGTLFDDTIRDVATADLPPADAPASAAKPEAVNDPPKTPAGGSARNPLLKWMLVVVVVVLGFAGAVLYWTH